MATVQPQPCSRAPPTPRSSAGTAPHHSPSANAHDPTALLQGGGQRREGRGGAGRGNGRLASRTLTPTASSPSRLVSGARPVAIMTYAQASGHTKSKHVPQRGGKGPMRETHRVERLRCSNASLVIHKFHLRSTTGTKYSSRARQPGPQGVHMNTGERTCWDP
jgi:hypothetical protein